MSQNFPKPNECFGRKVEVKLDFSNYVKKADLKGATGVDISDLATKSNLAKLEAEVDKIDKHKLKTGPADLSKLINVVENCIIN